MTTFQTELDVGNRAIQHLGQTLMASLTDISRQAKEVSSCIDKLRTAELRKAPWRFATRRAYVRPYTATTFRFIPNAWAVSISYFAGEIVMDSLGVYWIAQYAHTATAANAPGLALVGYPAYWQQYFGPVLCDVYSSAVTYNAGDLVYTGSSPYQVYISTTNAQSNHTPASGAPWQNIGGSGNTTLFAAPIILPAGVGITVNGVARTIFPLPNGFLRMTAPDPKSASIAFQATTAAIRYQDWELESNYLISAATTPLLIRFVADISDVLSMDPLFCETWAASIGRAVCEPLTQSQEKFARIDKAYSDLAALAKTVNWLEIGNTEAQEGDFENDGTMALFPNATTKPPPGR